MADSNHNRRRAAILALDLVGYSALMERDEEGTIARVRATRLELLDPVVERHGGRVVKTAGDGALLDLPSAIDAVRCALELQATLAAREAEKPPAERLRARMGVNLGEVVAEGGDLFGAGVIVASRLEALAGPGGIVISDAVEKEIRGRVDATFTDGGLRTLKHLHTPVRVWHWQAEGAPRRARAWRRAGRAAAAAAGLALAVAAAGWLWTDGIRAPAYAPASREAMAFPLPAEPSIAVLPFEDLSPGGGAGAIAEGLAETIITSLSRVESMFVIARHATLGYRGAPAQIPQAANELGVRYVLVGTVQRDAGRLRVTAQLVDALSGRNLWAERYDRELDDVFAVQDAITLDVVRALEVRIGEGEAARLRGAHARSLETYETWMRALHLFRRLEKDANAESRALAERLVEADPDFVQGWVGIGYCHWLDAINGWTPTPGAALDAAQAAADRALALDPAYPRAHSLRGALALAEGRHDDAVAAHREAVALAPGNSIAIANLGMAQIYAGAPEEGIRRLHEAMRLSPVYPAWYLLPLADAYRMTGQYEEELATAAELARRAPSSWPHPEIHAAFALANLGELEKAQTRIAALRARLPGITAAGGGRSMSLFGPYRDPTEPGRIMLALISLGLPAE